MVPLKIVSNVSRFKPTLNLNRGLNSLNSISDFINVLGTPGFVLVLDVLGPGEGSKCSTVLVILPNVLFPDPYEPLVFDNGVSSVNLNSGIDSFFVLVLKLYSISFEASEVT